MHPMLYRRPFPNRRRSPRGSPPSIPAPIALIQDHKTGQGIPALVENVSHQGCCLVVISKVLFEANTVHRLQMHTGLEHQAKIRWVKQLTEVIFQVGFEYLD